MAQIHSCPQARTLSIGEGRALVNRGDDAMILMQQVPLD